MPFFLQPFHQFYRLSLPHKGIADVLHVIAVRLRRADLEKPRIDTSLDKCVDVQLIIRRLELDKVPSFEFPRNRAGKFSAQINMLNEQVRTDREMAERLLFFAGVNSLVRPHLQLKGTRIRGVPLRLHSLFRGCRTLCCFLLNGFHLLKSKEIRRASNPVDTHRQKV